MSRCLLGKRVKNRLIPYLEKQQVYVKLRGLFGMGANLKDSHRMVLLLSDDLYVLYIFECLYKKINVKYYSKTKQF